MLNLSPELAAILAAMSTGHESDAPNTAAQVAEALGISKAQAAQRLGRLRTLGLVERAEDFTGYGATWARFDSFAPGLEAVQVEALAQAEAARPSAAQAETLESFGPPCEAAPHGLALRPDLAQELAEAFTMRRGDLEDLAAKEAAEGRYFRAAEMLRRAVGRYNGHGRRARLEEAAQRFDRLGKEREAQARRADRGKTPDAQAPAQAETVDSLKAADRFTDAGRLAYAQGAGRSYGCHFGFRSTRDAAVRDFLAGYDAAEAEAQAARRQERAALGRLEAIGRAPGTAARLNGFPVLAAWPRNAGGFFVLVDRGQESAHRYVRASWHESLVSQWSWGHYHATAQEALADVQSLVAEGRCAPVM